MTSAIRPNLAQNSYGAFGRPDQPIDGQDDALSLQNSVANPEEDSVQGLNDPNDTRKNLVDAINSIIQTGQALDTKSIKSLSSEFGIPPEQILEIIRGLGRTVDDPPAPRTNKPAPESQETRNAQRPGTSNTPNTRFGATIPANRNTLRLGAANPTDRRLGATNPATGGNKAVFPSYNTNSGAKRPSALQTVA